MNDEHLDRLLSTMEAPPLPPGLRTRVLAHGPKPRTGFWQAIGGFRRIGPAFAFAMVLGLGVGIAWPPAADETEFDDVESWSALTDDYLDFGS